MTLMGKFQKVMVQVVGPREKGVRPAQLSVPPAHINGHYEGVDLSRLPKYLCFKAALLREKILLQNLLLLVLCLFGAYFFISRWEIARIYTKLREKEYILAPGAIDFTTASPQRVSDDYVDSAVMSFVQSLGNINSVNIDQQYKRLSEYMSPSLKVRFQAEIASWVDTVKKDNIAEILKVKSREIISDEMGNYKAVITASRERYAGSDYLGRSDEVIEMILKLIPPADGKRWFLQMTFLSRGEAKGVLK